VVLYTISRSNATAMKTQVNAGDTTVIMTETLTVGGSIGQT
jgi:hypothetical protein